jgi:hypothetical protein
MNKPKGTTLTDRLETASQAKKAMLEKFRARPASDDPTVVARQESQSFVNDARKARRAAQQAERAEEDAVRRAKEASAAAEHEARKKADEEQSAREADEALAREAALQVEQKAARDARYAARKARK